MKSGNLFKQFIVDKKNGFLELKIDANQHFLLMTARPKRELGYGA